jgi:hypothetical protein
MQSSLMIVNCNVSLPSIVDASPTHNGSRI